MNKPLPSYGVITPVRDEEKYITCTLKAMVRQRHKPLVWVLVDDGSTDKSAVLIRKYAQNHSWIRLLQTRRDSPRLTGSAEIEAFNTGLELLPLSECDVIVKLDADLSFDAGYFEALLSKFGEDGRLGIASGVYLEEKGAGWAPVPMPDYHAAGASKAVRAECFKAIGGFLSQRGWDTVDEIRALALGWKTRHFPELKFYHLKKEGSGMGQVKTGLMHGEIMYRTTGGVFLFMLFKALARAITGRPPLMAGAALLFGYLKTSFSRAPLLVSPNEAALYQALLTQRLSGGFRRAATHLFGKK